MTPSEIANYRFKRDQNDANAIKLKRMESIFQEAKGETDQAHRHEYYTVVWLQEGTGHHLIDFNQYTFEKNQVYFVAPGQIHQINTTSKPKGWVLTFHPDFLLEAGLDNEFIINVNLFRQYSDSPPIQLKDDKRLKKIMDLMMECYEDYSDFKNEALGAALQLFLIECIRQCTDLDPKVEVGRSKLLIDFKRTVESKFTETHKVSDYAGSLSITPKHLNEVVKSTIGITAKEYIIDRLIIEAKRMLIHSDSSVKQIALHLGFTEPLHFNSFFKKRVNQTPLEFRKTKSH